MLKVGYADGSLLKLIPKDGDVREQLVALGAVTAEGRELLGGCVVVPIPDPISGQWTSLYGRGVSTDRHCHYRARCAAGAVAIPDRAIDESRGHGGVIGVDSEPEPLELVAAQNCVAPVGHGVRMPSVSMNPPFTAVIAWQ